MVNKINGNDKLRFSLILISGIWFVNAIINFHKKPRQVQIDRQLKTTKIQLK